MNKFIRIFNNPFNLIYDEHKISQKELIRLNYMLIIWSDPALNCACCSLQDKEGGFIVRDSSTAGAYTVSLYGKCAAG